MSFCSRLTSEVLLDVCKEVDLEINADKMKYLSISRHQNSGQNHIKADDKYF